MGVELDVRADLHSPSMSVAPVEAQVLNSENFISVFSFR